MNLVEVFRRKLPLNPNYTRHYLPLPESLLRNVRVVASDETPPVPYGGMLSSRNYRHCGQFPGTPPTRPITMVCDMVAIGRYVYVYLADTNHLSICEIEVYGTRKFRFLIARYKSFIYILGHFRRMWFHQLLW